MQSFSRSLCALAASATMFVTSAFAASAPHYVVTNDDNPTANTATFYTIGAAGKLTQKTVVTTGGTGTNGGLFGTGRVNVLHDKLQSCVYVSDAGSADVASISETTLKLVGTFKAGSTDSGLTGGIGLIANSNYLYAGFTGNGQTQGTGSIATYKILKGCKLKYLKSIPAKGLGQGTFGVGQPDGMGLHGTILVVAYGDGSIESFNISKGVPKSNHDEMNSTGEPNGNYPAGVDISKDGKFAIFGDIPSTSNGSVVEVSNISSGKLKPTKVYNAGTGFNSNSIELSPDETILYISNNQGGTLTADFFNAKTGAVSMGCISAVLRNFQSYQGSVALANNATGTGTEAYVPQLGTPSSINTINVKSNGKTCSLTEAKNSPVSDPNSTGLLSIDSYPPRAF